MNGGEYQALFMADCAKKQLHPLDEALKKVKDIDEEIRVLDSARSKKREERRILVDFLKDKGVTATQHKYNPDEIDIPFDDDTKEAKEMRRSIVNVIHGKEGLTVRDVMDTVKTGYSEQHNLIRQIKLLAEKGVLSRNSDGLLIKGLSWEKRDQIMV